jgi:hypothetical protein
VVFFVGDIHYWFFWLLGVYSGCFFMLLGLVGCSDGYGCYLGVLDFFFLFFFLSIYGERIGRFGTHTLWAYSFCAFRLVGHWELSHWRDMVDL